MNYLLFSFALLFFSFGLTFFLKTGVQKRSTACGGVVAGSLIGIIPALSVLTTNSALKAKLGSLIGGVTITLGIDPLSAFFLVAIFSLSVLVGIYGWGYLKDQPKLLSSLPFFPLLVAAMVAVVCARDGFFFLIVWEVMSLASFLLVSTEHEKQEVRHAAWIYLVATHLATAFLLVFFILLFKQVGSFSFDDFSRLHGLSPRLAGTLFLLALIGFGTKAGIFPLHVWLPHAHPAAPSYISALMSAVMIKTGIYGILRTLTFLRAPPLWWGELLIGLGVCSALLGVLYALMQHDLKRLLAYHSVENIGIIVIGIGLGLIGITWNQTSLVVLGFGGALFHVWNHALFKGLLFLGAGSVIQKTHTRVIDELGGLFKKMPITGATFFIASAAICGLPPLNGFISEWLIYLGLFNGATRLLDTALFFSIAGIIGIAFAGGLAVVCFTKVDGVVFLGEPRREQSAIPQEVSKVLLVPMLVLAFLCIVFGIYPQGIWPHLLSVVRGMVPYGFVVREGSVLTLLALVSKAFWMGLLLFAAMGFLVHRMFGKNHVQHAVTWDCGYAHPSSRMQYTASSFAEPFGRFFLSLLKPHIHLKKPSGFFPKPGNFSEHTEDLAEWRLFKPLFTVSEKIFSRIRKLQRGRIQGYLSFMFATLLVLLLWEVWFGI